MNIIGKRVNNWGERKSEAVTYWKDSIIGHPYECWYVNISKDGKEFYGNLGNHKVVEHEDGTITVSPSIKISTHEGEAHGFLTRGVWEDA